MASDGEGFEPWRTDFRDRYRELAARNSADDGDYFARQHALADSKVPIFHFTLNQDGSTPAMEATDLRKGFDGTADPVWLLNSFGGFFAYDLFSLLRLPFRLRPQNCCWRLCN